VKREISAGGLVGNRKTGQFVIIKDPYGRGALPKGLMEKGEAAVEAARRETAEEAGISAKRLKVLKKLGTVKFFYTRGGEKFFKIITFFLMETTAVRLRPQWEVKAAKWVGREELVKTLEYGDQKVFARKALRSIKPRKSA
jgi:8-oxo-dGTP pyrophosphatase MutT (NUDIX family)